MTNILNQPHGYDPLAASRTPESPAFDLLLTGPVFLDIIFTGLSSLPEPGEELWSEGMGSCPGGVANQAIAASRLGLNTTLAAAFGDDAYGEFNRDTIGAQEYVDLSLSRNFPGWHSPVTVSLSTKRDRSFVTHGHAAPLSASELVGILRDGDTEHAERVPAHGLVDLDIKANGDLHIDAHHTVEDLGITLGQADELARAVSDRPRGRNSR